MDYGLKFTNTKEKKLRYNELLDRPFINYNTHSILYAHNNVSTRIIVYVRIKRCILYQITYALFRVYAHDIAYTRQNIVCLQKYLLYIDVRITCVEVGLLDFFFTSSYIVFSYNYNVQFFLTTIELNNLKNLNDLVLEPFYWNYVIEYSTFTKEDSLISNQQTNLKSAG